MKLIPVLLDRAISSKLISFLAESKLKKQSFIFINFADLLLNLLQLNLKSIYIFKLIEQLVKELTENCFFEICFSFFMF